MALVELGPLDPQVDASEPNLDPGRLRTEEVQILRGT
jgi:hypothetical protein